MKKTLLILGIIALMCNYYAKGQYYHERDKEKQSNEVDYRSMYHDKIKSNVRLKRMGTIFAIVGGAMTVGGVGLIITDDCDQSSSSTTCDNSDTIVGVGLLGIGVPPLALGILLERIGHKRMEKQMMKLNRLKMGFEYKPHYKSITLSYRF